MSWLQKLFGNQPKTAQVAKERLQLIIAHERDGGGRSANFLPDLQRELIEVISKYVTVNPDDIRVSLEKQDRYEVLEQTIDDEGRTKYVRKGVVRVDQPIWDNRYMAGEEAAADSTATAAP